MIEWGPTVRVLVCDDHPLTVKMLEAIVAGDPAMELVGATVDPAEAVALALQRQPDVVVMDLDFETSAMTGIDATEELSRRAPRVRVLVVTALDAERALVAAVEAGAAGFVRKTDPVAEIAEAIRVVGGGGTHLDVERLRQLMARQAAARDERGRTASLTAREREILLLLADGASTAEIAQRLDVSPHTVSTHVRNLLAKLDVSSRLEAVALARRAGVLER